MCAIQLCVQRDMYAIILVDNHFACNWECTQLEIYTMLCTNKIIGYHFVDKLRVLRFKTYMIGFPHKLISIEDYLITIVSFTHLVSLCCRQCLTARVDQHR